MRRTFILATGLACAAAACSSNNSLTGGGTLDNTAITSDLSNLAADDISTDVDLMTGMDGGLRNLSGLAMAAAVDPGPGPRLQFHPNLTGCTFANGSFTCPVIRQNGLMVTRVITFLDAEGNPQSAYDSLLTASIHVVADISGDVTIGPWSATVQRHRDFTITGLLGDETTRTVNGTGNESVSRSRVLRNDSTRSYDVAGNSTGTDIVLPVGPNGGNGWPASGTITRTYTITLTSGPNSGRTVTRTVTITFDGTSTATATINGTTFTIDLPDRSATPRG
jgi:hypothetical protein